MKQLILDQVHIHYEQTAVVHGISLAVEDGEIGCLLGPSGCGKTTLLRAIAGFEPLSSGSITLNEQIISTPNYHLPTEQRNIGMVFQDYALFPHLNIANNIAFGLRQQSRKQKRERVSELLQLVDLPGYEKRYPHELSGGQQQRIALARALAPRPRLLLLDEPFGSQDIELREMLAREVRQILKREGTTAMLVTHDQHEAFAMADHIGVLQQGYLCQWGSAYELYHQPADNFVAEFIGQGTLLKGHVNTQRQAETALGTLPGEVPEHCQANCSVNVLIRPNDIELKPKGVYTATVSGRVFRGAAYLYTLTLQDGQSILAMTDSHHQVYATGKTVHFDLNRQHLVILPQN